MDDGFKLKEGTATVYTYLMDTEDMTEASSLCDSCDGLTEAQAELARELFARIAGKWPLWVLHELAENGAPLRFSRLIERVEGVSQKVLTQTLRHLERDGLVTRTLYPQVPPRVDYALTPLGGELLQQLAPLWRWMAGNIDAFEEARRRSVAASVAVNDAKASTEARTG
jgi:DNA-binding HxlR family transcriptional regulator